MTETDMIRGRRHAIYVLAAFCAVFFIGGIIVSYIVAANYGYGTGFGDGKLAPVGIVHGQGFIGDSAILGGAFVLDVGIIFAWYWLISRLEAPADDDPLPNDDGADLSRERIGTSYRYPTSPGSSSLSLSSARRASRFLGHRFCLLFFSGTDGESDV